MISARSTSPGSLISSADFAFGRERDQADAAGEAGHQRRRQRHATPAVSQTRPERARQVAEHRCRGDQREHGGVHVKELVGDHADEAALHERGPDGEAGFRQPLAAIAGERKRTELRPPE